MREPSGRTDQHGYLRRLSPGHYRGQAIVHWSMAIEERKTGWLAPIFYGKYREILAHTMFRYGLCCPIYCCMPDHIHLLWIGVLDCSDQRLAAKFLRTQLNHQLEVAAVRLQPQAYDHVLRGEERTNSALENVVDYIARNPERARLVPPDGYRDYPYTGCLVPGYPDLSPWRPNYWNWFWQRYSHLRASKMFTLSTRSGDGSSQNSTCP